MIKLLIADDEPHFREYMKTVLDWHQLGFTICGICKNSQEVIEILDRERPEILLLDINMPGMDGLSLAKIVKGHLPQALIAFITGYSEFEYARKALQIGAKEYLLKPFSKDELRNTVTKMKYQIQKRLDSLQRRLMEQELVKESLLKQLVGGVLPEHREQYERKLKAAGICLLKPYFLVSVLEIDKISSLWQQPEEIDLWKFGIVNIAGEILASKGVSHLIFKGAEERIISILNMDNPGTAADYGTAYQEIQEAVSHFLGFTVSVGIGDRAAGLAAVKDSYRQALAAVGEKFLLGNGTLICYADLAGRNKTANFYCLDLNDSLLGCLRRQESEELFRKLEEARKSISGNNIPVDYAYMMTTGILSICLSYIMEQNGNIAQVCGEDFSPYAELYAKSSIDESFLFLKGIYQDTLNAFHKNYTKRGIEIINQVTDYIAVNYADSSLTVERIAAEIFLDSSYIRKVVSRQLGCTVSDLIMSARMREAKKLMDQTEMQIGDIAEQVGYGEPGYFSKCFKKFYGVSPKRYGHHK